MPAPIDAAGMAQIRALVASFFPDTYEILRTAPATGGPRGAAPAETVAAAGDCELREVAREPAERTIAERHGWEVAYVIDLPWGVAVKNKDRIRVNGSRTFEVGGVVYGGNMDTEVTAVVTEVG